MFDRFLNTLLYYRTMYKTNGQTVLILLKSSYFLLPKGNVGTQSFSSSLNEITAWAVWLVIQYEKKSNQSIKNLHFCKTFYKNSDWEICFTASYRKLYRSSLKLLVIFNVFSIYQHSVFKFSFVEVYII